MRDYRFGEKVRLAWNTVTVAQAPTTPTGVSFKVYVNDSLAELTAGLTSSIDHDGKVGSHLLLIDLASLGANPGDTCHVRVDATVDGIVSTGWIGSFSIEAQGRDVLSRGQLDGATAISFTLPAGKRADVREGDIIRIVKGTGKGFRIILTYDSGTGVGSVTGWLTTPVATDYYEVIHFPTAEKLSSSDLEDNFLTSAKIAADAIGSSQIAVGAIGSSELADNAITASKINADAITAAKIAADAVTEIQAGLALAANLTNVANAIADLQTRTPAALVGGKMDASLNAAGLQADAVTEIIDAIKAFEVMTGYSFLRTMKGILALVGGKSSGHLPLGGPVAFRDPADTQDIINYTLDANGNRTSSGLAL